MTSQCQWAKCLRCPRFLNLVVIWKSWNNLRSTPLDLPYKADVQNQEYRFTITKVLQMLRRRKKSTWLNSSYAFPLNAIAYLEGKFISSKFWYYVLAWHKKARQILIIYLSIYLLKLYIPLVSKNNFSEHLII